MGSTKTKKTRAPAIPSSAELFARADRKRRRAAARRDREMARLFEQVCGFAPDGRA